MVDVIADVMNDDGLCQGSYWKRMCGKILEHPYVAAQAELLVTPACLGEVGTLRV